MTPTKNPPRLTYRPNEIALLAKSERRYKYSDTLALATAEHAVAVYRDPSTYAATCMEAGFEGGNIVSEGAVQIGVSYSQKVIMIVPRGSSSARDWIDDICSCVRRQWRPWLPKGVRIGFGFRAQINKVVEKFITYIETVIAKHPAAVICVSGHSLGGALVPLVVAALHRNGYRAEVAYMHNPPRVGSKKWAKWYDQELAWRTPTFLVVNTKQGQADLVTRVPKKGWGFRHVGHRVFHELGEIFEGEEAWLAHRDANPVGHLEGWRVISKLWASATAHMGEELLETLRRRCGVDEIPIAPI